MHAVSALSRGSRGNRDTPSVPGYRSTLHKSDRIYNMPHEPWRADAREKQVKFRLSAERKKLLEHRAADAGVPVQVYIEARVLGISFAEAQAPGRTRGLKTQGDQTFPQLSDEEGKLRPTG